MLSFVMTTHNEGTAFKDTLEALANAMQSGDRVIALDAGSTDDTPVLLAAFSEVVGCDVMGLEGTVLHQGEALALGLELAQTPYVMLLDSADRVHPDWAERLRQRLSAATPDTAMVNSGWWYADPSRALARVDATRIKALPEQGPVSTLYGLCPEPRRLVLAREAWLPRSATLAAADTAHALYVSVLEQSDTCVFVQEPVVLHPHAPMDPAPLLTVLGARINALPREAQVAGLRAGMIWADDAVARTPADQGSALIAALEAFSKGLPRRLRGQLHTHDGPVGVLWKARKSGGQQGALLCFAQMALATQQQHNRSLLEALEQMQKERQAALPLPHYLQALYDRARGL